MTDSEKAMVDEMSDLIKDQNTKIRVQDEYIKELQQEMADMENKEYDCWCTPRSKFIMVAPMPGQVQHTEEIEMYPIGTEVIYKGQRGTVSFCDPASGTCSICVRVFEDDPARNVCLVVYKHDLDHVTPVIGNHSRGN